MCLGMRFLFTSYAKHPRSLESIATLQLVRLQSGDTKAWISINNASSSLHMLMQTHTHTYTHTHTHVVRKDTIHVICSGDPAHRNQRVSGCGQRELF